MKIKLILTKIHYSITKIITRSQINCQIFENNRCNIEEKITPNRNSCYCNIQTHSATLEITDMTLLKRKGAERIPKAQNSA